MPSRMEETRGRTEQAMPVHLGDPLEAQEEKYLYTINENENGGVSNIEGMLV